MGNAYRNAPDRAYFERKFEDVQNALVAYIDQRFNILQKMIEESERLYEAASQPVNPPENAKRVGTVKKAKKEKDDCEMWKDAIIERCRKLAKEFPEQHPDVRSVLRKVYLRMDIDYGSCLAQDKKDYKNGSEGRVSTLEAISVIAKRRNEFEPILYNLEESTRLRAEREKANEAKILEKPVCEIIQPLINMRGDKSTHGCATYMMVKSRMLRDGADYEAAESRAKKVLGINRKLKNKEILEGDTELKRKFAETVAVLLYEEGKKHNEKTS